MFRSGIIGLTALVAVGCAGAHPTVVPFEITGRREFPREQRAEVWSRAVRAFDWTGRVLAVSDEHGGVLQSTEQGSMLQCTEYRSRSGRAEPSLCKANETTRLTIGDDGIVELRISGKVRATLPYGPQALPWTELDRQQQQTKVDRWLDYVVGKTDYKPDPPNPPLSSAWLDLQGGG